MRGTNLLSALLIGLAVWLSVSISPVAHAETLPAKQLVFDEAGLLDAGTVQDLTGLARKYGDLRETDILILTTRNDKNEDIVKLTEDFYDRQAPGYDKPHGNTAIVTLDMRNREVYLAGFYKGETYLDDGRLDRIRAKITPDLSQGNYRQAFQTYIETVYRYMGVRPGVNPDLILFNGWFQLAVSLLIGGIVVGLMAYRSGGRAGITSKTYEDAGNSGVLERRDQYLHTTTTKQKVQKSNGRGGGGGGGGRTGGGHSHSGSRGSF